MGQSNISREPVQFTNEPIRPTAEEFIQTHIYKASRSSAYIIVRRGRADVRLKSTDRVPKCSPDVDIYIHIEEALQ